ncbi:hypothetical protein HanIR_Chr15g0747281 [Helianthus annuus]|nr:hypothetical protein HanIR_Chr15g0747281 [Helianthus annuus]
MVISITISSTSQPPSNTNRLFVHRLRVYILSKGIKHTCQFCEVDLKKRFFLFFICFFCVILNIQKGHFL